MSTFTCDIDESAVAHSFVNLGFTDVITEVGAALSKVALASAATFLTTGAGASSVDISHGPIVLEQAVAHSYTATPAQTQTTVLSSAVAQSFIDRDYELTLSAQGAGQSFALTERELVLLSQGAGQSFVLPASSYSITVNEQATGQSGLFGFNDYTYLTQGAGQSSVVLNTKAVTTLLSQGDGQSAVVLSNGPGEVALATAEAQSAVVLQANQGVVALATAEARSFALVPRALSAWVMNTESTAMSRYDNVPVQSMAVIGGMVLGLGEDGLYKMDGKDDDGKAIVSSLRTGKSMMGYEALKNLGDIVISYVCAGVMQVRISCYGGPVEGTFTYSLPERPAAAPRGNRLVPGKGMRSRYFQFEFYSDNAVFGVDGVTADVAVNARRI